jgi:environmental stress-induced protein Ves
MDAAAMKLTHLKPADYKSMPWKNGGGTTTELMAQPDGNGSYLWRLSIADVAQSGPFSDFSGFERTIMLLEGTGFILKFDRAPRDGAASPRPESHGKRIDRPLEPFRFAGEWQTDCTLINGPVRDFNLIATRGVRAQLEVMDPTMGLRIPGAKTVVVYCIAGQLVAAGKRAQQGETLRIDDGDNPLLLDGRAKAAVIRIGGDT